MVYMDSDFKKSIIIHDRLSQRLRFTTKSKHTQREYVEDIQKDSPEKNNPKHLQTNNLFTKHHKEKKKFIIRLNVADYFLKNKNDATREQQEQISYYIPISTSSRI